MISIGDEVEEIDLTGLLYYHTETIKREIEPYIPTFFKLKLNKYERYIFISPFPEHTIYIEGDLIKKDQKQKIEINKNYFVDKDEIFTLSDLTEFTIFIFGSEYYDATFYVEQYRPDDLLIDEYLRNDEPIDIKFSANDCIFVRKKYILGIYDKETYIKKKITYTKYWTSDDGEMNVYYRNNINLERGSLFPFSEEYKKKKEYPIFMQNYIDFFTFTCFKPGILSLRSQFKSYDETTHMIGQNSINLINIGEEIEILQLITPLKPPSYFLFFAICSLEGKKIKITPNTPELFNETFIEGDKIFKYAINLHKFKPDQLAIKVNSTDFTQIEVIEVIQYNYSEYTIIDNNEMTHITDNHFVKFLNINTKNIKVIIKGLKYIPINYALVKLFTKDIDYLPMANRFKDLVYSKIAKKTEIINIKNEFYGKKDDNKKYLAFIFSIPESVYYEYDAQVIEDGIGEKKANQTIIIIIIIGSIIFVALIIFLTIIFFIKKKDDDSKFEMDVENIDNQPLDGEKNKYIGINLS